MKMLNPDIFLQPLSKISVTGVIGVAPASVKAISVTPGKIKGVIGVTNQSQSTLKTPLVTPITPAKTEGVTRKPASIKAVTPVTLITPKNEHICDANDGGRIEGVIATTDLCGTDPADIYEAYTERAGIVEYDGRLSRPEAERRALEFIVLRLPDVPGERFKEWAEALGATWRPENQFFIRDHNRVPDAKFDEIYRAHWLAVWLVAGGFSPEDAMRLAVLDCKTRRAGIYQSK